VQVWNGINPHLLISPNAPWKALVSETKGIFAAITSLPLQKHSMLLEKGTEIFSTQMSKTIANLSPPSCIPTGPQFT
jgi:hypothetical protein